jgi:hypothetical protein
MNKKTKLKMLTACAAAVISFGVWSCHKGSSSSGSSTTLTETDAAQVATDAVSPETGGLVAQISSSSSLESKFLVNGIRKPVIESLPCGSTKDTTIVYTSLLSTPGYTYKLAWAYKAQCTVPQTVTLNFTGTGTYSGLVLGSQFNSTGSFSLSNLDSTYYTYNSTFSRTGTVYSKANTANTYNHTLSIASSNIKYDPVAQQIVSGTATISVKLTNSAGATFTYGGTITFEGNKTAKLVLNSGIIYNITWS